MSRYQSIDLFGCRHRPFIASRFLVAGIAGLLRLLEVGDWATQFGAGYSR